MKELSFKQMASMVKEKGISESQLYDAIERGEILPRVKDPVSGELVAIRVIKICRKTGNLLKYRIAQDNVINLDLEDIIEIKKRRGNS